MSAFLGPIHHWLYHKIQLQEGLTQALLEAFPDEKASLSTKIDESCGQAETRPLETVIDEGNIHGWLQNQVSIVEARLAATVTELLVSDSSRQEKLAKTAFAFGKDHSIKAAKTPQMAFQALNDILLDGMPCDHVNQMIDQHENEIIWKRSTDIHSSYWLQANGNPELFDILRNAWINGMLDGSGMTYTQDGTRFVIHN